MRSCSQVGFTRSRVATGTRGLLHHVFTLAPRQARGGLFSVALSVPFGPTCYVAPSPVPYGTGLALESSDFPPFDYTQGDHLFCSGNANLSLSLPFFHSILSIGIRLVPGKRRQPAHQGECFSIIARYHGDLESKKRLTCQPVPFRISLISSLDTSR
jgi:hypothetical protein